MENSAYANWMSKMFLGIKEILDEKILHYLEWMANFRANYMQLDWKCGKIWQLYKDNQSIKMAIAYHYDLTKLKFRSKLTKIIDTIYRKQWQEETSQVSQDKGLVRNSQGHPPTVFISHCFSLGTWFFIGSHNIRPGVEPIHVGRLIFVHHDETPKACEKLPRPPPQVFVNYYFSLRIQSFFTGSHKIQPGVSLLEWLIFVHDGETRGIHSWSPTLRYAYRSHKFLLVLTCGLSILNSKGIHSWSGARRWASRSHKFLLALIVGCPLYTILDFKITPSNFTQTQ